MKRRKIFVNAVLSGFGRFHQKQSEMKFKGKGFPPIFFIGMICVVDILVGKLFTSSLI